MEPRNLQEALEFSPESPELLTTLGLLHLQQGENHKAFDCLGNALTHDPRNTKAILAAGWVTSREGKRAGIGGGGGLLF